MKAEKNRKVESLREQEMEILLSLSGDFASVRNTSELLSVVIARLQNLIGFHHVHIGTIDESGKTISSWMNSVGIKGKSNTKSPDWILEIEGVIKKSFHSSEPLCIELGQLKNDPSFPLYIKGELESGMHQVVIMRFSSSDQPFGFWFLYFKHIDPIDQNSLRLIKGISHQISSALLNIKSIEAIRKRDEEKSRILAFSNIIASVKDREKLSKIIWEQLHQLFNIRDYCFFLLSEDYKQRKPYLFDVDAEFANHPSFLRMKDDYFDNNDKVYDQILQSNGLRIFDVDEWRRWSQPHPYMDVITAMGMKQMGGNVVRIGDEVIGIMTFSHDNASEIVEQYALYESICSQLGVVASNLYSADQMRNKEEEKSSILEFSNTIASVRDKDTLATLLREQLHQIFGTIDYCIWLNSKDKTKRIAFLYDKTTPIAKNPLFEKGLEMFATSNDYLFSQALKTDEVIFIDSRDWQEEDQPAFIYGQYASAFNIKAFGANRIRIADEDLAVIVFSHNDIPQFKKNLRLYWSICSQLAITLSNLLATIKISEQLEEINQYKEQLEEEKNYLQEEIAVGYNTSGMIGNSPAVRDVFNLIQKVSSSSSTVLILGETGTGKELVARAIHNNSTRKDKLMVKVNCAALPANLIESELFGHEKGSFTGAHDKRIGKFELANNGTLFLDEIGEMPMDLQVKLLRALQEKEIERVGGKEVIKVDVRIIAATNRDLEKEISAGKFREDLYYRLNIFPVKVPPLRERVEDIAVLAQHFIEKFSKQTGKKVKGISNPVLKDMKVYPWPGNIRELEHFIERSVLLTSESRINNSSLQLKPKDNEIDQTRLVFKPKKLSDNERDLILSTLSYCNGQISGPTGAAVLLGVPATTLHSKMKKLGVVKKFG